MSSSIDCALVKRGEEEKFQNEISWSVFIGYGSYFQKVPDLSILFGPPKAKSQLWT